MSNQPAPILSETPDFDDPIMRVLYANSPPRLNNARVCIWCNGWSCASARCVERHESSPWAICAECHGGLIDGVLSCGCVEGVIQITKAERDDILAGTVNPPRLA